jgi:hypothetical protein
MKIKLGKVSNMKRVPYSEVAKELGSKLVWIKEIPKAYEHLTSNDVYFDGLLAEFLLKMHDKHPKFVFQPRWIMYADSESPSIIHTNVSCDKVVLGDVEVYAGTFTMRSDRIIRDKPRSGRVQTSDIKRAGREFTKYFKPESAAEVLATRAGEARRAVYNAVDTARGKRKLALNLVDSYLLQHIMDNLDTYGVIAKSYGATDAMLDAAKLGYEEWSVIDSAVGDKFDGYIVHIKDGLYMVGRRHREKACDVYEAKDLPAYINDKLGQLKLVQDNTYIRNVGLRVDDNTFYVRGELL